MVPMLPTTQLSSFSDELQKLSEVDDKRKEHADLIWKKLLEESPVKVHEHAMTEELKRLALMGPHYMPERSGKPPYIAVESHESKQKTLNLNPNAALAHEIGHAQMHETLGGRVLAKSRGFANLSLPAGLLAGYHAQSPRAKALSLLLPALAHGPQLADEAAASITGYKLLKQLGADEKELKEYRSDLAKAWATYAAQPALTAAATLAAMGIGSIHRG